MKNSKRTSRERFGTDGLFKANRTRGPFIIKWVSLSAGCWRRQNHSLLGSLHDRIPEETQLVENIVDFFAKWSFQARFYASGISGHHPPSRAARAQTLGFFFFFFKLVSRITSGTESHSCSHFAAPSAPLNRGAGLLKVFPPLSPVVPAATPLPHPAYPTSESSVWSVPELRAAHFFIFHA